MLVRQLFSLGRHMIPSRVELRATSSLTVGKTQDNKKFAGDDGSFKRQSSQFRQFIERDANAKFPAEAGRYHLYVSLACPWAHRTLVARKIKGLELIIDVSIVHWKMGPEGWKFPNKEEILEMESHKVSENEYGTVDKLYGLERLSDLYYRADPEYKARFTVPCLWDSKTNTVVNNELSDILRMFNTAFNTLVAPKYAELDLYPQQLREKIDELNGWIFDGINNGVYKVGFATAEEVYRKECLNLFVQLDKVEAVLKTNHEQDEKFLVGNVLTEADIRLYTTIVRFDPVYHQHFKCNIGMIRHDYPHIHKWLKHLYWDTPGFLETTNFDHIKKHYTKSHIGINPLGISPVGPLPNIMR